MRVLPSLSDTPQATHGWGVSHTPPPLPPVASSSGRKVPVVLPNDEVICLHCQQPLTGWAGVPEGPLCHPSGLPEEASQLDCYRLVTVWGHPMPCDCSNALGRAL